MKKKFFSMLQLKDFLVTKFHYFLSKFISKFSAEGEASKKGLQSVIDPVSAAQQ
jgi:hypothetical protein